MVADEEFEADERIIRLRFVHSRGDGEWGGDDCEECSDPKNGMGVHWPCLTIRTLNGEKSWRNTPDAHWQPPRV